MWSALRGREWLQRAGWNIGWLTGGEILRLVLSVVVTAAVARHLGPVLLGKLNIAMTLVGLVVPLGVLGLHGIAVREIVRDREGAGEVLGTSLVLRLVGGVALCLASVGLILVLRPGDSLMLWMVLVIAAGWSLRAFEVHEYWFRARVEGKYPVLARSGSLILVSLAKLGMVAAGAAVMLFAGAVLLETVLYLVSLFAIAMTRAERPRRWSFSSRRAAGLLKLTWPLILCGVCAQVFTQIDKVMLGQMAGDGAAGVYSAAVVVSKIWYFLPAAVLQSVFPHLVSLSETDEAMFLRRLRQLLEIMVLIAVGIALPLSLLSRQVMGVLYGAAYEGGVGVLRIHIFGNIVMFLGLARNDWANAKAFTVLILVGNLAGALTNVALNYALIPVWGMRGAACTTLISYSVAYVAVNFVFRRARPVGWMQLRAMLFPETIKFLAGLRRSEAT